MPKDHDHNPDPNQNAARIVREATAEKESTPPPADLEAAWEAWFSHFQNVDNRTMLLMRASFEAGWEAGQVKN